MGSDKVSGNSAANFTRKSPEYEVNKNFIGVDSPMVELVTGFHGLLYSFFYASHAIFRERFNLTPPTQSN